MRETARKLLTGQQSTHWTCRRRDPPFKAWWSRPRQADSRPCLTPPMRLSWPIAGLTDLQLAFYYDGRLYRVIPLPESVTEADKAAFSRLPSRSRSSHWKSWGRSSHLPYRHHFARKETLRRPPKICGRAQPAIPRVCVLCLARLSAQPPIVRPSHTEVYR